MTVKCGLDFSVAVSAVRRNIVIKFCMVVVKHLLMHSWGTSSVMDLRSLGVSGLSHIRHPLSGGPAEVHDASACAPAALSHGSALFIQSHLEAFSAASVLLRMALLLLSPVMPSAV